MSGRKLSYSPGKMNQPKGISHARHLSLNNKKNVSAHLMQALPNPVTGRMASKPNVMPPAGMNPYRKTPEPKIYAKNLNAY